MLSFAVLSPARASPSIQICDLSLDRALQRGRGFSIREHRKPMPLFGAINKERQMKQVRLLTQRWAEIFRSGGRNEQGNGFDLATATGKAHCRTCGERITKGASALVGYYDFTHNYGSWTSVRIWLHPHDCSIKGDTHV